MNYLGPNLELRNCMIKIQTSSRWLTISSGVKFSWCEIMISKKTINFAWYEAVLDNCKFTGVLVSHYFGYSEDTPHPCGKIVNCSFEEAILDDCRFSRCDLHTIRLPRWPCFTVLNPSEHTAEMINSGSKVLMQLAEEYEYRTSETVAQTEYAIALSKRIRLSVDVILGEIKNKNRIIIHSH